MNRLLITLLFITYTSFAATAQSQSDVLIQTKQIAMSNGLSNNSVNTIIYDSSGYMWIGTDDGLNRYNGYSATNFKNKRGEDILPSNKIVALAEDSKSRIWIGTDNGVAVYDPQTEQFSRPTQKEISIKSGGLVVNKIIFVDNGAKVLCITERDGVLIYDMSFNLIAQSENSTRHQFLDALVLDDRNTLIASTKGLKLFTHNDGLYSSIILREELGRTQSIIIISSTELLVGTEQGVQRVAYSKDEQSGGYNFSIVGGRGLPVQSVNSLYYSDSQGLWIGTMDNGFFHISDFKPQDRVHRDSTIHYLAKIRTSGFLPDYTNQMWVATLDMGITKQSYKSDCFRSVSIPSLQLPQLASLESGLFLIKSYNNEFFLYDYKDDSCHTLENIDRFYKPTNMLCDKRGNIWLFGLGTIHKLKLDEKKKTIRFEIQHNKDLSVLTKRRPNVSCVDMYGNIWLGYDRNLCRIVISDDNEIVRVESTFDDNRVFGDYVLRVKSLYADALTGSLWVGTNTRGLFRLDIDATTPFADLEVEHIEMTDNSSSQSIPSNSISSIIRDKDDVLWIGTESDGFFSVVENEKQREYTLVTEGHGLVNNIVKSIICDNDDELWVATSSGLSSYNHQRRSFKTYRELSGLPFDDFWYSSARSKDGVIMFSNVSGLLCFDPHSLLESESNLNLKFSGLKINSQYIKPNESYNDRVILDHSLRDGDHIKLKYDESSFTIGVDLLCHSIIADQYMRYRLDPINSEWLSIAASQQSISFNGLKPGRYILNVEGGSSQHDRTEQKRLYIRITPPIHQSTLAYILYAVIILSIIVAIVYSLMRFQSLRYRLRLEASNKENQILLNEERQKYFANITHELKTPLTLIMAPLDLLSKRFTYDIDVKENLNIMRRQSKKMLQLIDLAHGLQLDDADLLKPNYKEFIFRDFINDVTGDFSFMAGYDKKSFRIEYPDMALRVRCDYGLMEKLLNNLLNNAFKHTQSGDEIVIRYCCNKELLTLTISDSGAGIAKGDLPYIFDRFYKSASKHNQKVGGTGIGLAFSRRIVEIHQGTICVESEIQEGTTFTINLPVLVEQVELNTLLRSEELAESDMILGDIGSDGLEFKTDLSEAMVYIVEDNSEMRRFLTELVSKYYNVTSFTNGQECIDALENEWPDVILSDVMMPELSGDDLCRIVKSDLKTSHIPVILLTACNTIDDQIKGLEIMADNYIGKPFYPKHVLISIEAILQGRKVLKERFQAGIPLVMGKSSGISSKDSDFLSELYEIFAENLDNDEIDLDLFPRRLGLNRTTFYAKVKALCGGSPYELLKKYRLQRAADLLLNEENSIKEVCMTTGFKSRTHFSRIFKEHFGVTPTQYIENSRKNDLSE